MVTFAIAYLSATFRGISTLITMEISHIFTLALIAQIILSSLVSGSSTTATPKYEKTTTTLKSTNSSLTTSTGSSGSIPVSSTPGQCNIGYFSCKNGRCEPFESLCGDVGVVTTTSASPLPTSTLSQTTGSVTMVTGHASSSSSSPVSASSTPMTPNAYSTPIVDSTSVTLATPVTNYFTPPKPTPTTPEFTTTLGGPLPGPETCLPGWEDCKDGSCEPFHWLCVEHQSQAIVGR